MTFEAFFLKKKIDLDLLKADKPDVFAEFVSHYEQMSEKSFDHTKKYWFNNLRIVYPLSEEKELALKEAFKPKVESHVIADVEGISSKAQISSSSVAFKPRFKVPINKVVENTEPGLDSNKPEKSEDVVAKPAGFKPRFKADVTKNPDSLEDKEEVNEIEQVISEVPVVAKPAGFKPRFKAGVTKNPESLEDKEEVNEIEEVVSEVPVVAKPAGFKPRFKAGITKPAVIVEETIAEDESATLPKEEAPAKAIGFKPRFKSPKKDI